MCAPAASNVTDNPRPTAVGTESRDTARPGTTSTSYNVTATVLPSTNASNSTVLAFVAVCTLPLASRAPPRTQVSDASGQLLEVNAEVSLTIYVGGAAMEYEFLVVKALSVPLILG